jgi:hypothetical protein
MAEGKAASNLARDVSAISPRSTNCRTTGRIRSCTTSSATMSRGSATRNRTCASTSNKKGTRTAVPHARPPTADRISRGSHANSGMATIRRRKSSRVLPDRCARRMSWYNGPPSTSEKSYESDGGALPSAVAPPTERRRASEPSVCVTVLSTRIRGSSTAPYRDRARVKRGRYRRDRNWRAPSCP